MKPSQIITGSANPDPSTFSYTIYDDDVYYSYSSGSNVYILKGVSLKVIQVLTGHQSDVTCISWLSNDPKLLTSSNNEIFLYTLNKEKFLWEHVFTIPCQFEITSMSWLQTNSFIVGGSNQIVKWKFDINAIMKNYYIKKQQEIITQQQQQSGTSLPSLSKSQFGISQQQQQDSDEFSSTFTTKAFNLNSSGSNTPTNSTQVRNDKFLLDQKLKEQKLFNKQAQMVWKTDCSSSIAHLACSPDGSLFATCGKFDRMIKIWFLQKKSQAKLIAEEQQLKLQQEQLSLLQQREELAKQKNSKGFYKEQFNKLLSKEPTFKLSKKQTNNDEDENDITSSIISKKPINTNPEEKEPTLEEKQKQLDSLKELLQKQKNKKFEQESYGFIYLPHPRSVTWVSWRNRKTASHNILLTNCKDGVVRLWQQSPQSRRLQFNVSNIIPSNSDVIDWVYSQHDDKFDLLNKKKPNNEDSSNNSTGSNPSSNNPNNRSTSKNNGTDSDPNSDDSNSYLRSHDFKLHLTNPILLRQKDSLAKTKQIVDWIIGIKLDGSLVLWKLKTDDSMTKQTSSISLWINSQILSPQEVGPNRIISHYQAMPSSDYTPGSIKVCFNSFNGAISSRRFYIQNHNQTQISNASPVSRCYGHESTIKKMSTSLTSPYLSSLDSKNNIIIWNSTDSSKIQSPNFLIDIGSFTSYYSMAWSPNQKFCFFSNVDGIFVYYIEVSQENHIKSSLLSIGLVEESVLEDDWIDEVHVVEPFNLLYYYDVKNSNQDNLYLPYQFFLVGLNKHSDKIYIWGVNIERDLRYSSASSPSILKSKLLATKEFERDSRVSCICAAPKGIFDYSVKPPQKNDYAIDDDDRVVLTHPICIIGTIDGYVSVLGITPKVKTNNGEVEYEDWEISEMVGYAAYQQPVESVKPAYFGRFASKAFSSNMNPEIHIWELESHTPKLRLEDTIRFFSEQTEQSVVTSPTATSPIGATLNVKSPIATSIPLKTSGATNDDSIECSFSFASLDDGNYSIAIGYGNQVKILTRPIDRTIGSYKKPWIQTHYYDDLTSPCTCIAWGKDLSLYVSAGNQILVFTKWSKINENTALLSQMGNNCTSLNSIYHQHSELTRPLPLYHPKFLTEYMMAGKFGVVEKILKYIFNYLFEKYGDLDNIPKTPEHIPPLSIEEIVHYNEFDGSNNKKAGTSDDVDKMNSKYYDRDYGNDDYDDEDDDEKDKDLFLNLDGKFNKKQAQKLNEILSSIKLAYLTSNEQIQLLAVTDTYGEIGEMRGGLDENGSRFLLSAKVFQFLRRSLPPQDRPISLSTTDILWALHSEAQETILQACFPTDPDWNALKQIGAGLWIKSPSTLRNVVEKLAKTTYINSKDPRECSLYYMALKKKGALVALHKANKDVKQVEFLQQDFTQAKWITAANKSAFLLQSKHKYDLAASLFLLAGQLKKAVNLIIQMQGDFQLALVISRLYEGENGEVSKMIIEEHIIPQAKKTNDRSLLSIANWLLKKYEDAIQVLIPSVSIDSDRKLDENNDIFSPLLTGGSPNFSSRNSTVSSPIARSQSGISTITSSVQQTSSSLMSQQLRVSEMGPSTLYFFRFLKNHVQLRLLPEDKKKEDPFLRSSSYSYFNSGCSLLALENIEQLEKSHPKILSNKQEREEYEKQKQEEEAKEREKQLEIEKQKQKQNSNDLGLDFGGGGGSNSNGFFNSSNYDMGLDFGGGSSSSFFNNNSKPSNDLGLDFGGGSSSSFFSSNNDSKPSNDLGLDFGGGSNSTNSMFQSNSMGLDFGPSTTSTSSNSNTMGLDFGPSTTSTSSNIMGLDFGPSTTSTSSNSNTMGLDFGPSTTSTSSNSNTMGLDFGPSTTTTSNNWDFLDTKPKEELMKEQEEQEKIKEKESIIVPTIEVNSQAVSTVSNKKGKLSLFPLIDNEFKSKLVVKVLIETIMETRESNSWDEKSNEFKETLEFLCKKNNLVEKEIVKCLIEFCLNRQYIYQVTKLSQIFGGENASLEALDSISTSIIKSLLRFDDDNKLMIANAGASQSLQILSQELYNSVLSLREENHSNALLLTTVYLMIFLLGNGAHRYDILLSLYENKSKPISNLMSVLKSLPLRNYKDDSLVNEDDEDEDDDDDEEVLDEAAKKKLQEENTITIRFVKRFFDYMTVKYFKSCFEELVKIIPYHEVFDSVFQRLTLWIGSSQTKLVVVPQKILDVFVKNPQTSNTDNFLDAIRVYKEFNSADQMKVWEILVKNEKETLEHIILGIDPNPQQQDKDKDKSSKNEQLPVMRKISSQTQFPTGTGKIKFEEETELYKDGDILQSFCLDPTSPELNVMAIATTRGIREIDLKQLVHEARDEYDIDPSENLSSSSHGKKPRITGKSASSLHISKSKIGGVFGGLRSNKPVDHNIIVQCLESHPNSSFYLSGGIDGSVCLWQFGIPEVLTAYQLPQKPRIVRCKFNQSGTKFGACDMAGNILLWQFAAQEDTLKPFYQLQAHSKQTLDFTFLNSGSLLATAGISNDSKRDICLWDVLLPPSKSLIASYTDQENGASSIVYSPKRQTIIVGGKKGSLSLYDIRTHRQLESFKAHQLNTKTLALDPFEEFICSGSSDGNIKVWSLPSMTCLNTFEDSHKKQTFVRPTGVFKSPVSTYGVMQVRLENNSMFSCGADGRLTRRRFFKL
ncbi:hypothetical protein DICPUDRAFT_151429 [Dictyostelium purpureum]|uniref:RAVE complex protein Rav1 C-terminal domain-containing protein n=1 Tax=Dictyostelium purpureum TaxID=5786 RepID=F0ZIT6_DICPU|nr:uncharacterized protein DICPUDRAFT_151429 [Dictyostelium purpureum]EGC36145.1 hypothetical protein DICPUDRAFT_151429 [Dictyostelium purpureum]|eukprot:XP_003287338.1 hypothetical protein DICPUDRAFT_151429 [Dictyostelium purpureum]